MTRRNDLDQTVQKEKNTHSEFGRIHLKYDSLGLQRLSILFCPETEGTRKNLGFRVHLSS